MMLGLLYADTVTLWIHMGEDPTTRKARWRRNVLTQAKWEEASGAVRTMQGLGDQSGAMLFLPYPVALKEGKDRIMVGNITQDAPPADALTVRGAERFTLFGSFHHLEVTAS